MLSGIKAHTIRIWEKRYGLLTPHRTETNIRYYDETHLKRLLNVSLLLKIGHKISKISSLTDDEMSNLLKKDLLDSSIENIDDHAIQTKVSGLIIAMIELDEDRFNSIFTTSVIKRGLESTITSVIYPFLEKVGVMWTINEANPAQEHFITNLIRQKVIVASDSLQTPADPKGTFVLFLPENELHELGLLMANYLLKKKGYKTVYLGQNVPFNDLKTIVKICEPDFLLTFFVSGHHDNTQGVQLMNKYSESFPESTVCIAGKPNETSILATPSNVVIFTSAQEFIQFLDR